MYKRLLRETVAREQPGSNVCRCIPNWGIAFLVIAISICALLYLLSHFKLSLISLLLSSFALAHTCVLRYTHTDSDFSLSLTHIEYEGVKLSWVAFEKLAERKDCILIIAPTDISCRRSGINIYRCTTAYRCEQTLSINNIIEHNAKWQRYWQEPRCVQ